MESIDVIIVGAGVVGLAIARALSRAGREVIVIEANAGIGEETSSRNSEVIHAGIYYPAGSLMARACVAGKAALVAYCREHNVPFSLCGKLIAATDEAEAAQLLAIQARAERNGVDDLRLLSRQEAHALEPALRCTAALLSPSSGIVDSHAFMLALQGDAEAAGAAFAFKTPFLHAHADGGGLVVETGGDEPMVLRCRTLINAAGLGAEQVARAVRELAPARVPRIRFAKGNYFVLNGRAPFSRLIYPAPVPGGLGTHLTLDLAGQARFGPDVEWVEAIDYRVDPARASSFYAAVRRYWPDLPDGALQPGYAGIRPKITGPGEPAGDFRIDDARAHGVPGLINLFGVESPGLTASLTLADHVRDISLAALR
jgi:L-2-hydroxyglutarate oxidase LhgO